jgi:Protein of unknown function (DUF1579)
MQFGHSACQRVVLSIVLTVVGAGSRAADKTADPKPAAPELLQNMQGNWAVVQKMWPGRNQPPVDLPSATAKRRLIQGSFLEEVMEPAQNAAEPFNRTAYLSFNTTSRRFEYFSLDSRMPQMMNERSGVAEPSIGPGETIDLDGSHFVAPTWGNAHNVPFRYRLRVGGVMGDRQLVQLLLTPEFGKDRAEFVAFEYRYTRLP